MARNKNTGRTHKRTGGRGREKLKRTTRIPRHTTRRLRIPTVDGVRTVSVNTARGASNIGKYWNAVHKHLAQGDQTRLATFVGKSFIDARGKRIKFLTDPAALDELGGAGVLSFETIYAKVV